MIRRSMLFVAAGFTASILTGHYMGMAFCSAASAVSIFVLLLLDMNMHSEKFILVAWLLVISFGAGTVCCFISNQKFDYQSKKYSASDNAVSSLAGTVTDCEKKRNSSGEKYIEITVKSKDGTVLVKKYFNEEKRYSESEENELAKTAVPGAKINAVGTIQSPAGRRNPGCFDYALYLKSIGITSTMTAENLSVETGAKTMQGRLFLVKENFIDRLSARTNSDTAAVIKAIMFGDKGELDEGTLEVFQRNGTAHILAVSGLHIGIIYGFLLKIWTLLGSLTGGMIGGSRRWCFFGFIAAFFSCYMVFAGFSPSVVRAVLMVLLHVFAQITNRRYDLNNAALLVVTIVLAHNPFMIFNAGFQMSFLAVLTMTLVMPFIKNVYSGIFLASLAVQIGLGPFVIYNFNYLSLAAVFINVPVIAIAGMIVPLGIVAMTLEMTPAFGPVSWAADVLCRVLQWFNDAVEINGITTFQIASPPLWALTFYYLLLLVLVTEEGRLAVIRAGKGFLARFKYIIKTAAVVLTAAIAFAAFAGDGFGSCNMTFVDVGQGDCMCIKADAGILHGEKCYLIDGGGSMNYNVGKQTLRPYLLKNGIRRIDGAFVTHLHTDHYQGICELAREGMVKNLYVYEGNRCIEDKICSDTGIDPDRIHYLKAGDAVDLRNGDSNKKHGSKDNIEVMWPDKKTVSEYAKQIENPEDENEACLILKLNIEGKSILATGDIGEELMDDIACNEVDCDILKVPHHGSKYSISDKFIDAASPEYAVIQVGKNNYGHPAPETVHKYESLKGKIIHGTTFAGLYRNDECGAVGFEIRKGKIRRIRTIK